MSGSTSGSSTKKRKKQENNAQAKGNKSLNEKKRRDTENSYIEELAELISSTFTDMSSLSVKPDKCAILQETVAQIKHIKEQGAGASSDAVQQGEVSSSKPTILSTEVFGPLLLEALEGFLFVVSSDGKIEFCTENITQFIKYRREEVLGQSVYNIIHHGDHGRFSHWLLPMTVSWGVDHSDDNLGRRTFNCRFLVKPPSDSTVEEKQQRPSKYENMQISSTQLPQSSSSDKDDDGSSDSGPCLMCVARRIPPNEKPSINSLEQFTMKLNTAGRIIGIDSTGVSTPYSQYITKDLVNKNLEELVQGGDVNKIKSHLKEASSAGQSTTPVYKLLVSHDKSIHVQSKLKYFKSTNRYDPDFIMATHSIVGENENNLELGSPGAGSSSSQSGNVNNNSNSQSAQQQGSTSGSTVGGQLISNVNGANSRELGNTITLNNSSAFQSVTLNPTDFDLNFDIFPSSTWELGEDRGWERPESRQSLTPVQSPLYSNPPQPSPAPNSFSTPYAFSPIQESNTDEAPEEDSGRLRNLLMTKRPSTESDDGGGGSNSQRNNHRILKGLLNQEDEEAQPQDSKPPNNMLLKLLNTQNDDDNMEAKAGLKNQNELLQQLLNNQDDENNSENNPTRGDGLLSSLGYRQDGNEESRGGRKRPSSDDPEDQPGAKRPLESLLDAVPPPPSASTPSSTSSGKSKLWEQNKMLASLLERRPTTPTSIPPIPASVISATPQDKFPRLAKHPQAGWSGGSVQTSGGSPGQPRSGRSPGYSGNTWDSGSSDPVLSDILDQVIEIVPDVTTDSPALMNMINSIETEAQQPVQQQFHQDFLNETMAINAIQKSLMLCESAVKGPTYNSQMSQGSPQAQQQFPPPPMYQQRQRFPIQQQPQQIRQQFSLTNQQQHIYLAQRSKLQQQQQLQKQRLLHLQQQQQLVIPSNATAPNPDPALHNIDSLINNTVAPNVSLQRSSSVPDSQLSPVASYPGLGSVPSPGQRRPFSPVNGGMTNFSGSGSSGPPVSGSGGPQARLSPSSLQGYQQQPQLSPRLTQGQQNYGGGGSWSQQSSRLSLQQQENPVLNAQLTSGGRGYGRGGSGLPPVRSLASPQRFGSAAEQQAAGNAYQFRLQRQVSAPQPQQSPPNHQLPGGSRVGYSGGLGSPPLCHHPPGVYGDQQYCYPDPAYPPRLVHHSHGGNNGVTEFVRQELRAKVGARSSCSSRPQVPGSLPLPTPVDLESLAFDIQSQGVSDTSKMWGSMNEMGAGSPQSNQQLSSRSTMEEVSRSNDQKSSLLQKLLSE